MLRPPAIFANIERSHYVANSLFNIIKLINIYHLFVRESFYNAITAYNQLGYPHACTILTSKPIRTTYLNYTIVYNRYTLLY
jgi:hypothetical protein